MDFGLSTDQESLKTYARDFLEKECPAEVVRKAMESDTALDGDLYAKMTELGWMGVAIPEEFGGQGMTYVDLAVLIEEMGRALVPGPFFASVCLAAPLLIEAGTDEQKKTILRGIASGSTNATVAFMDPSGTTSTGNGLLNGSKSYVLDAHVADWIIVAATDGDFLFCVDTKSPGLEIKQLKTMDTTRRWCDVRFTDVEAIPMGNGSLADSLNRSIAMLCAESVGGAHKVMDLSVDYAKVRVQFGRPIGSFQAVKHKCADMLVDVEMSRSAMYYAAWAATSNPEELPLAASVAKAFCGDAYTRVAAAGIQVHGGIGFTWEHDMHLYFKRAKSNEVFLGDPTHHRELVAGDIAGANS